MAMGTAIYNDFEPRKWKPKKKRQAGALEVEHTKAVIQRHQETLAKQPEQELMNRDEVIVKVLRICANPRLVLCAYQDESNERRVLVRVGKNANFVVGMELKTIRPATETEVWGYGGRLPRFKGRW